MNNNRQALIIKYIIPNTMLCICVCKYIISNLWCKERQEKDLRPLIQNLTFSCLQFIPTFPLLQDSFCFSNCITQPIGKHHEINLKSSCAAQAGLDRPHNLPASASEILGLQA